MNCDDVRARLSAYLDGELADEPGSVVRGHLRGCAACRGAARDEAALRDGLRAMEPVDPPPSLWAGVQAQLAAAEVRDAERPAWRRALARWKSAFAVNGARLALGSVAAAAVVIFVVWHARPAADDRVPVTHPVEVAVPSTQAEHHDPVAVPVDVSADLLSDGARKTASYAAAIDELMAFADDARKDWTDDQRTAFDGKLAALRGEVAHASAGKAQQRAQQKLFTYLQGAVVRDEIALASTGGAR